EGSYDRNAGNGDVTASYPSRSTVNNISLPGSKSSGTNPITLLSATESRTHSCLPNSTRVPPARVEERPSGSTGHWISCCGPSCAPSNTKTLPAKKRRGYPVVSTAVATIGTGGAFSSTRNDVRPRSCTKYDQP